MMLSHNREAGAIAAFTGLASLVYEGLSPVKVVAAFFIAIATGTGYKLGTMFAEWLTAKVKGKAK